MTQAFDFAKFNPNRPQLGTPVLQAIPKLPQCVPNVVTGSLNHGNAYPVPYPQTMPVQEPGPPL
jgi:phospholipase C